MMDDVERVIIDNGGSVCRAGFAGDDAPKVMLEHGHAGMREKQDTYVGEEAQTTRDLNSIKYPITRGIVTNWDDMEKVWRQTFRDLEVDPKQSPVLLTEAPLNPTANREKMAQCMFETFCTPALYIGLAPVLASFAAGRIYGVFVHCGEGVTSVLPCEYDGSLKPSAGFRLDIAGHDITSYLADLLNSRGYSFDTVAGRDIVRDIKEKLAVVAENYEQIETAASCNLESPYQLPDGQVIKVKSEMLQCTEILFRPSLLGMENEGIHELIYDSAMKCPVDYRWRIFSNVVVSGGTTMLGGFRDRLQLELTAKSRGNRVYVQAAPERKYSAWIGASMLGGWGAAHSSWVTKQEYEEYGPFIVHKKCF
eukprot:Phypoly_transcript_10401.p1 GENE.Phypoly_transcript_10401~~Phypoly_transcript_10401.p1  ORF type:complete len:365 (+),score=27.84 Phypoly_transcript_10401:173-1267(+)